MGAVAAALDSMDAEQNHIAAAATQHTKTTAPCTKARHTSMHDTTHSKTLLEDAAIEHEQIVHIVLHHVEDAAQNVDERETVLTAVVQPCRVNSTRACAVPRPGGPGRVGQQGALDVAMDDNTCREAVREHVVGWQRQRVPALAWMLTAGPSRAPTPSVCCHPSWSLLARSGGCGTDHAVGMELVTAPVHHYPEGTGCGPVRGRWRWGCRGLQCSGAPARASSSAFQQRKRQ